MMNAIPILAGRLLLGVLLALALGPLGAGLGWVAYVFSGAVTRLTLLVLLMGGAAIGVAGAVFLAWLGTNRNSPNWIGGLGVTLLVAAAVGAWAGYQIGSLQEVPCCAGPVITPITYIVLGATATANGAGLSLGIAREWATSLRRNRMPQLGRQSEEA